MIVGKMLCEGCGKDVTGGLWAFILGANRGLNPKQTEQLAEFKKKYGTEQIIWCWECIARMFGAKTLAEKAAEKTTPRETPAPVPQPPVEQNQLKPETNDPPRRGRPKKEVVSGKVN